MSNAPLLQISGLRKTFDSHVAVDDVSLDVQSGECLALVGHNGAGKTTIFKMILGLLQPSAGTVLFQGQPINDQAVIGFLPESVSFHHSLTGYELLRFYESLRGVEHGTDFDALLDKVNLQGVGNNRISTYSKGMRQRLGLEQTLIGNPKLLILDEPTSGLDPTSRRSFYHLLDELRLDGTTIVLSSHALSEVEAYTSNVAILKSGQMLANGPIQELAAVAGLPVKMTLQFHPNKTTENLNLPKEVNIQTSSDPRFATLDVDEALKLKMMHHLSGQSTVVADILIHQPTLDDIYAHFQEGGNNIDDNKIDNVMPFPVSDERKAL